MTSFTPSVNTTIFPRVNFYKSFTNRAIRRDLNGRIFGEYGDVPIDASGRYPAVEGSLEFAELLPFPVDLGPDVATTPTRVIDLRNPEQVFGPRGVQLDTVYDLNPLHPRLENTFYYPPASGSVGFIDATPFPVDLGPDVATTPTRLIDLRTGDGDFDFNPLIPSINDSAWYPPVAGSAEFSTTLPFPVDLGPDVATTPSGFIDLRNGDSTYDFNPLIPSIDDPVWYPSVIGADTFNDALPFPVELGPDVATATSTVIDLRLGNDRYDFNPLEAETPAVPGSIAFSNALPFPVELGPDVATATTDIFDLIIGDSTYNLN